MQSLNLNLNLTREKNKLTELQRHKGNRKDAIVEIKFKLDKEKKHETDWVAAS